MKHRHRVLSLLATLSMVTYLDRVCISVAGPRIQDELHLGPQQWGLITGAFAVAYALFEVPSGYLADRFGARVMMTRIVLWWSAFTTLTGFAVGLNSFIVIRFLFGAGEAGAYPTASSVVARWFPLAERGRTFGTVLLCSQLGGAVAPLLIVPVQMRYGWRASFYVFGLVGALWCVFWWRGYRDRPQEQPGISAEEIAAIGTAAPTTRNATRVAFPWAAIAANGSAWSLMGLTFAYLYSYYFFLFWLPTYMIRSLGFNESQTRLSAAPFALGILFNGLGGLARDGAVRRFGPRWGPSGIGVVGLGVSALAVFAALASSGYVALAWLAVCYGGITFQQPTVFATGVDIGRRHAGSIVGCLNSAGAVGGLVSSFVFGYLIERFGGYDAVLLSMACSLSVGALLWLRTDATHVLQTEQSTADLTRA